MMDRAPERPAAAAWPAAMGSGSDASAESLAARYLAVREQSDAIAAPLSPEDCAVQTLEDVSPIKWHLAHQSWYFETFVLEPRLSGYRVFDDKYRVLFNSYYNLIGDQHPRPHRGLLARPRLDEVMAYRRHVDREIERWLGTAPPPTDVEVFVLGLHHEQQHQELMLTDLKHVLATHPMSEAYRPIEAPPATTPKPLTWHVYDQGLREIGARETHFAFDCERPRHRRWLEAFELASRPATSGEFLSFIEAGGYERPELWLADGWARARVEGWVAPLYWERRSDGWWERTLSGARPVRQDLPVAHVSYYEADAFARWFGARLPDEAEWEVAASSLPVVGNLLGDALQPCGVPTGSDTEHPAQMFGDVWEWTRSPFGPYPGYAPPPGVVGEYNGKFMCNQLTLRGGSCFTPRDHIRATYRNFFYPHQRWQQSGIRLARDAG